MNFWYPILVALAAVASVPLFFLDLGHFRRFHRIIFLVLVLVAVLESWCSYLAYNGKTNIVYYNAVFVYTLPLLYFYFFQLIFEENRFKNILYIFGGLFLIYGVINTFYFNFFQVFHHSSYILGSLLILVCCFYFFYSLISKNRFVEINQIRFPAFWIVTFLLFFYSSSILNFASIRYVNFTNYELMRMMQNIINTLGGIMYLVFALSFYLPLIKDKKSNISRNLS